MQMSDVTPSVKGMLVAIALEQAQGYVKTGEIREQDLEDALGPDYADLAGHAGVMISSWYPAELYDRLLTLMMTRVGNGKAEYLVEQGRQAVASIVATGIYGQLGVEGDISRAGIRKILTLAAVMYNFTTWEVGDVAPEGDRFQIVISNASDYPDSFRWRNLGFVEAVVDHSTGRHWRVESERETRDRIIFDVRARADSD